MVDPRTGARALLGVYLLFIVYGSFFPFHFAAHRDGILANLANAVSLYDAEGGRNLSLPDLAANTLLGVPVGFLLVVSGLAGHSQLRRVATSGLCGLLLATAVEIGQAFSPGRFTSIFDVVGQAAGALAGAMAAESVRGTGGGLSSRLVTTLRERPQLAPLAVLLAVLAADALYPYAFTLDVSTVWGNVKSSAWRPFAGLGAQPWHALLVDRVLPYAAVTLLVLEACSPRPSLPVRAALCGLPLAFAAGLEVAKLFVEGRSPQTRYVLLAASGTLLGLAAAPLVRSVSRRHGRWLLAVGAVALITYHELRPFDFTASTAAFRLKITRIEWVPFASHILAEPQAALFDIGKKLALGALLGLILPTRDRPAAVRWALLLGVGLEIGQLAERSHRASVTDVALITGGAWLSGRLLTRYRAVLDSPGGGAVPAASALRHE
jgi:VanZ family protein